MPKTQHRSPRLAVAHQLTSLWQPSALQPSYANAGGVTSAEAAHMLVSVLVSTPVKESIGSPNSSQVHSPPRVLLSAEPGDTPAV